MKADVAVVGVGCRLPGAGDASSFWSLVSERRTAFSPLPPDRWDPRVFALDLPEGKAPAPVAGLVDDVELDWRALRLPPVDAEKLHRIERAALASMSEALADAGVTKDADLRARTRILVASSRLGPDPRTDQARRIRRFELQAPVSAALAARAPERKEDIDDVLERLFDLAAPPIDPDSLAATASLIAGRVANLLDLSGGHLAVDEGASSSLAALALAARALSEDECDAVLVCGLSPLVTPSSILAMAHRGWLSSSGARPFDPKGDGTLLGEGAAALVLMRGDDAGARRVYARVEAVGSAFAGLDPSPDDVQRAVVEAARACEDGRGGAARVRVVETRAAGIAEVDAAEARGLSAVYDAQAPALSSTVAHVGFLPACAGMVALLKAALSLERGRAVPSSAEAAADVALGADDRIAVSDAGLAPTVHHAVLASSRAAARARARARRGEHEPIAIVGLGVVAPGSEDATAFWRNVLDRVDGVGDLPPSRFDVDRMVGGSEEVGAILRTRLAATVEVPRVGPERYDLPARLLRELDPAVALSLEVARQALLDAGHREGAIDPARVKVVVGQLPYRCRDVDVERRVLFSHYLALTRDAMAEAEVDEAQAEEILREARRLLDRDARPVDDSAVLAQTGVTAASAVAAAFGFTGGSTCVDAACASSLAAVHIGAQALRRGEHDLVLCGGVAYNLLPEYYVALSMLGVLSSRGEPPFSVDAAGFVPGEGAGCAALMRLSDARAQGRRVYAVLRGVGCSSDGRGVSVFAPSVEGQALAIRRALDDAAVEAESVDLIEAHGTGTKLGDEIELKSYRAVYGVRDAASPATLGTIKSQLGHLSSAAGIVGLAKAAIALSERVLPPSLFDVDRRSMIVEGESAFELATLARGWTTATGRPRRAAVSSFGLGGVNYHAVLEEDVATRGAEERPAPRPPGRGPRADRFEVALAPLSLPARAPLFPVRGRRALVVAEPDEARARAVVDELSARGAQAVLLRADAAQPGDAVAALLREGPFDVVVDLTGCAPLPGAAVDPRGWHASVEEALKRSMAIVRAVYDDLGSAAPLSRAYAVVTAMGGDMGLLGADEERVHAAALLGLAKGVKQELPHVMARGVDFDPREEPRRMARLLLDEIEDGNERMEVGYAPERMVMNLVRAPLARERELERPIALGDVFLFSGGGRGIVFECALAMAMAGVRVVVTGRTEEPSGDEPWARMDEAELAEHRKAELARRRAEDPKLTPARFAAEFDVVVRRRELSANLARARRLGVDLRYEICDVADEAAVRALVRSVRERYGRLDGVVHGAMVEWSTSLPKKTDAMIERTLRTKSLGFLALHRAVEDDPPRHFVSFGSGAGRFGSRGQADYCAANALVAALSTSASRRGGGRTRYVTIDWTAWSETGAAVRDPDIAALVRATGVTSIKSLEGVYWFMTELMRGAAREVVVFEERMLSSLLCLGESAEGKGARAVSIDDRGCPLVPGRWPLVDAVTASDRDRISFERTLDVERDAFLAQHLLDGVPILPATFGCEILGEAAALLSPGWELDSALDVQIGTPVKLHRGEPLLVRATAVLVDQTQDRRVVECETRSDLALRGRLIQRGRLHHRGRFLLRREGSAPKRRLPVGDLGGLVRARSFFHMAKDPVSLGPLFCRAEWIQIGEGEVTGEVRPPRQRDILSTSSYPFFQVDPLLMDSAFQVAANWDGHVNGWVSIPTGVAGLSFGRTRERGEGARVHARVVRVEDPVVLYDIDVVGDRGEVLLEVRGLKLHRVARLQAPARA